ncbi:MAG TPA: hypothetical protein VEI49_10110 [Terriglobales bacterium]|nr:hypothetical protein [Terriglobales bacterium]
MITRHPHISSLLFLAVSQEVVARPTYAAERERLTQHLTKCRTSASQAVGITPASQSILPGYESLK